MVLAGPRKPGEEEEELPEAPPGPRTGTHISQQEGIHLIVVSVKQKTQGLPGSWGQRKITGEVTKDPALCETHSSPSSPLPRDQALMSRVPILSMSPEVGSRESFLHHHLWPREW